MAFASPVLTFLITNLVFVDMFYLASGFDINLLQPNKTLTNKSRNHENKIWNFNDEFANDVFIFLRKRNRNRTY